MLLPVPQQQRTAAAVLEHAAETSDGVAPQRQASLLKQPPPVVLRTEPDNRGGCIRLVAQDDMTTMLQPK